MPDSAEPGADSPRLTSRASPNRLLTPARLRFWGVVIPIHLTAFAVLSFGTYRLLERAYTQAGATAARLQLDQAIAELPFQMSAARAGRNPHVFEHLLAAHQPIGLRLYHEDGTPLGAANLSVDTSERELVESYRQSATNRSRAWVEQEGDRAWVRGVMTLTAGAGCTPCHTQDETLGYATMKLDFTGELDEIRQLLGRRVVLLLVSWLALIGAVAFVVQRTVRRSARRLEADLVAASAGEPGAASNARGELPLDPVSAELHRTLRDFLERRRAHDVAVADRLAHVDQLASLGSLAAGLAHEIKNPLAGIQGALELLLDETEDTNTASLYTEMLAELKRVNEILHRLLESARPAPLRLITTDLGELLTQLAELLGPSLRRKGIELRVEVSPRLPALRLDAAKLRQVVINLVQNAAEAMSETGGLVVVRAGRLGSERTVVLTVEDDGPGIAESHRARLFEPFFTTKFTGTGLGLAISKSLVAQHGGRIDVDSEPGRGTRFMIVLPEHPQTLGGAIVESD